MTSANKYPEATMRWADFMYDFEANLYSNFGVKAPRGMMPNLEIKVVTAIRLNTGCWFHSGACKTNRGRNTA